MILDKCIYMKHYVKSVQIRSDFWSVFSCIQSEYRNMQVFGHFSRSKLLSITFSYLLQRTPNYHCVKSVQMRNFFWSAVSCIRTEYGDLPRKSPYSVQIQENTYQKKLRIWTFSRSVQVPRMSLSLTNRELIRY